MIYRSIVHEMRKFLKLAATVFLLLTSTYAEIVINNFLSFEGFDEGPKDWNVLYVSRQRPLFATASSIYFQLYLDQKEIFGYHRDGESELSFIQPNDHYLVSTSSKGGELDTIEVRGKEEGQLVYRVKVEGRKVSVVFAPEGYVDPLKMMDVSWGPWSASENFDLGKAVSQD